MDFNTFFTNFKSIVDGVKLTTIAVMIVVNLILGIAVGIKTGNFNIKEIGDFMYTRVLPYLVCYLGVGLFASFDPAWAPGVTVIWGLIDAALLGAILQNLKELGVNFIPVALAGGKSPK